MAITIVGLGPGNPAHLTREAWDVLSGAAEVYLRTARHPTVAGLPPSVTVLSFDDVYESADAFGEVYERIAARVLELGRREQGVVYAVPGHPSVAEATVGLIAARAAEAALPVHIVPGLSFVEVTLTALGVDALPNLQLADALEIAVRHHPPFQPDAPALVAQLYAASVAGDVKLTLMNQYPDDHQVALVHAVGTPEARVEWLPLYELDHSANIAHLTTLYVPPLPVPSGMESLQETAAHLRAPDGCPWDKEQTHQTLRTTLLEETHEVLEAIDADDPTAMREEFGDLLLQIVLQSQIAVDEGEFTLAQVIAGLNAKLIRRHPHVFGDVKVSGVGQVLENWEKIKAGERAGTEKPDLGALGQVPPGLPSLAHSVILQRRAARVGFDWPDVSGVIDKVREETAELQSAHDARDRETELGDLLFAVVNWARWLDVDPESALRQANAKFRQRFAKIEAAAAAEGRALTAMTLDEMEAHWQAAKSSPA